MNSKTCGKSANPASVNLGVSTRNLAVIMLQMEIGLAVTNCLQSTKIAFQLWVTQSNSDCQNTCLEQNRKSKIIFFFYIEKDGRPK